MAKLYQRRNGTWAVCVRNPSTGKRQTWYFGKDHDEAVRQYHVRMAQMLTDGPQAGLSGPCKECDAGLPRRPHELYWRVKVAPGVPRVESEAWVRIQGAASGDWKSVQAGVYGSSS